MTTIVYDHRTKTIAADSRAMAGFRIDTDSYDKAVFTENGVWFIAGSYGEIDSFIKSFTSNEAGCDYNIYAFYAESGAAYHCIYSGGKACKTKLKFSDAIGSGSEYALTAIDYGADAKTAVEMAAKRDSRTGGAVRVFSLEKMDFL